MSSELGSRKSETHSDIRGTILGSGTLSKEHARVGLLDGSHVTQTQ